MSNPFDVTQTSPDYRRRSAQWRRVRDALEGEDCIKERGTEYLPKSRGMKPRDYNEEYKARAVFYSVAERTLRGLVGLVLRTDPVPRLPSRLDSLERRASPEGFTLRQLVREALRENLSLGRYGILVDVPKNAPLDFRPLLATYQAEDITCWEEEIDEDTGQRRVTRVVVREEATVQDDEASTKLRELFLDKENDGIYTVRLYEKTESEARGRYQRSRKRNRELDYLTGNYNLTDTFVPTRAETPLTKIPFVFVSPFDQRARTEKPPFLDLVDMNLAHYRNSADYEQALHLVASPTPYLFGVKQDEVPAAIGPSQLWHSTRQDVNAGFVEFNGTGVEAIRRAMRDKEGRMAVLGARLIRGDDRENVTAETTRLETREEMSILVAATESVEEAFTRALQIAATWTGESEDSVDLTLNRDFVETRLSDKELVSLVAAWQAEAISRETLHRNLQRGEIMDAERTLEDELESIAAEPPSTRPAAGGGMEGGGGSPPESEPNDDEGDEVV